MTTASTTTYRIMIVDDEVILRSGIVHLCNWSDYGIEFVAQAANGQEALALIEAHSPHVVITDIVMPVMDGVELTKNIKKMYPHIKIVVLSSYSEFNYVREVFKYGVTDYLLKPKVSAEELIALIQSLCSDVDLPMLSHEPAKFDRSLVLSQWLNQDTTLDPTLDDATIEELKAQFPFPHFHMVKASTNLILMRTSYNQSQMEQIILQNAQTYLSELHYTVVFLKNEMLVLSNYDLSQEEHVRLAISQFAIEIQNTFNYISFVSAQPFQQFEEILPQHERLTPYLGKLFYFPGQPIVDEDNILLTGEKVDFDLNTFTTMLRMFAMDDACKMLTSFFDEVKQGQAYDDYSLKRICQNIVYTAISTIEQYKRLESGGTSSKLKQFKSIDLAHDIAELEHVMTLFITELQSATTQGDQQHSILLHQIYDYVQQNYANDISLTEMANHLHMNYSYLSSYFKQRTGENLTTYINRIRVEQAKKLLLDLNLSVSEVSAMTGFSEHNYFSKVFKKLTGFTPLEFRNQALHS
ncbi:response regulator [Paenibacillus turicensis]|uniref:response regulator transcription factor n=1 Tax=Paenibacillus turicensis TaxID=160487 RepID=UPI003D2C3DAF